MTYRDMLTIGEQWQLVTYEGEQEHDGKHGIFHRIYASGKFFNMTHNQFLRNTAEYSNDTWATLKGGTKVAIRKLKGQYTEIDWFPVDTAPEIVRNSLLSLS